MARKGRLKSRGHPEGALVLTTYEKLRKYLSAFASGHLGLVILLGERGLAKSRTVRSLLSELKQPACWIEGNATAFGMYEKLYRHRHEFVVIDDVDSLHADRAGVRLLKCLCQTEEEKAMAWHSDTRSLEKRSIPREFTTKSRVIIISNDWRTLNRNVAALQDRGHVLLFQPGASEVHREAGRWFQDREIFEWFEKNLHRVFEPSLRLYVRAQELKAAGVDWTEVLSELPVNLRARLASEILESNEYQTTRERVEAFVERGGGCRATYFNYRNRLGHGPSGRGAPTEGMV
jgi:hypothetical protein